MWCCPYFSVKNIHQNDIHLKKQKKKNMKNVFIAAPNDLKN